MPSPSTSYRNTATRVSLAVGGLTLGGGGAGWLVMHAVVHKPSMTAAAAVAATVALAANAGALICRTLPEIIKARSDRETARIRATAEAQTMVMRAQVRTALAQAGIEPGNQAPAAEMMRLLAIDPDMSPDGHRLNDDALARLLSAPRPRSIGRKPGRGPRKPGGGPKEPNKEDGGKVIPLRPDR
jgi:hypothetical protein